MHLVPLSVPAGKRAARADQDRTGRPIVAGSTRAHVPRHSALAFSLLLLTMVPASPRPAATIAPPADVWARAETVSVDLEDPPVGNGQTAATLGARMRARFIARTPNGSGTLPGLPSEAVVHYTPGFARKQNFYELLNS